MHTPIGTTNRPRINQRSDRIMSEPYRVWSACGTCSSICNNTRTLKCPAATADLRFCSVFFPWSSAGPMYCMCAFSARNSSLSKLNAYDEDDGDDFSFDQEAEDDAFMEDDESPVKRRKTVTKKPAGRRCVCLSSRRSFCSPCSCLMPSRRCL